MVYQFGFQEMKEAFRQGVIPPIVLTAHALPDAIAENLGNGAPAK